LDYINIFLDFKREKKNIPIKMDPIGIIVLSLIKEENVDPHNLL